MSQPELQIVDASVAVVVVNYRVPDMVKRCLAALSKERPLVPTLEVVVVDGGSADGSAEKLAAIVRQPEYREWVSVLPLSVNGGFGWANNEATCRLMRKRQPPQFIHLLNPDTEVESGAVQALRQFLEHHPQFAAVGSQLIAPEGCLTESAFRFVTLRDEFSRGARTGAVDRLLRAPPLLISASDPTEVDWTTGASVMFRADALRQVGLFDEGFFLYHEEVELMWRLRRARWRIALEPRSRVRHVAGSSTGMHNRDTEASMEPRRPKYWYRSRTRYLALTRGKRFAALAFVAWLLGYIVWFSRRQLGLAPAARPIDHALRDHIANSFPRRRDGVPAIRKWDAPVGGVPVWMQRGSL